MKDSLHAIDTVFVRKPLYTFSDYKKIPNTIGRLGEFVSSLWSDKVFKEALFLASEDLYTQWKRLTENSLYIDDKNKHRLNISVLKYYIRITTRSTPFGIFSSHSSIGIIDRKKYAKTGNDKYIRVSSINVEYLLNIVDYINTAPQFRYLHYFKLNSSMYPMGTSYRYVEKIRSYGKQEFVLSSIESDEVLILITDSLKEKSMTFSAITSLLLENVEQVSKSEISQYLNELITSQYIITDFDISLNRGNPIDQLSEFLLKHNVNNPELANLEKHLLRLKELLLQLDKSLGNDIGLYQKIYKTAKIEGIQLPPGSLLHVNMMEQIKDLSVDEQDVTNVKKAIEILVDFTSTDNSLETNLTQFGKAFYERYEDQAVPLVQVLDTESGIGYKQNQLGENDFSSLIDDLDWPTRESDIETLKFNNKKHKFWKDAIIEATFSNETIDLKRVDTSQFKESISILAQSFSALTKKIGNKVFVDTVGGNTALGLIARFSTIDSSVKEVVKEIINKEEVDDNLLHVELLFLPNEKAGNIIIRQVPRKYELAYLTKASSEVVEININDLYIKYVNGKIAIFSRKLNKKLKIYHSNAHNYHYNSLPVYQFLCDLQMQDEYNLNLDIGRTNFIFFDYIPRIIYGEDIILSPATWRIYNKDFVRNESSTIDFPELKKWLKKKNIPRYVYLSHSDNKLLIDTENDLTLEILLDDLSKRQELILSEFLYDIDVTPYDNELVFSFINKNAKRTAKFDIPNLSNNMVTRSYIPGDEWLYYKIYTGNEFANKLLLDVLPEIIEELKKLKLIDKWFFIRYNAPSPHLRLRFHLSDNTNISKVVNKINFELKYYVEESIINKIVLSTYKREVERYEGEHICFSEDIFFYDSELVLKLKQICRGKNNDWLYSLKCIDSYFDLFALTLHDRLAIMENLFESFHIEFNGNSKLRKQLDLKFRKYHNEIDSIFTSLDEDDKALEMIKLWSLSYLPELRNQIVQIPRNTVTKLIVSFIHMHINRMLKARQRRHEFVMYAILFKYYKAKIGRIKYSS